MKPSGRGRGSLGCGSNRSVGRDRLVSSRQAGFARRHSDTGDYYDEYGCGTSYVCAEDKWWESEADSLLKIIVPRLQRFRECGIFERENYQRMLNILSRGLGLQKLHVDCVEDSLEKSATLRTANTCRGKFEVIEQKGKPDIVQLYIKKAHDVECLVLVLLYYYKSVKYKDTTSTWVPKTRSIYSSKSVYKDTVDQLAALIVEQSEPRFVRNIGKRKFLILEDLIQGEE